MALRRESKPAPCQLFRHPCLGAVRKSCLKQRTHSNAQSRAQQVRQHQRTPCVHTPAEHVCARHPPHDSRSTDARRHATTDGSTAVERTARRRAACTVINDTGKTVPTFFSAWQPQGKKKSSEHIVPQRSGVERSGVGAERSGAERSRAGRRAEARRGAQRSGAGAARSAAERSGAERSRAARSEAERSGAERRGALCRGGPCLA